MFVYKRADHTRRTIESLQKNRLAQDSALIVFSDGARAGDAESGQGVAAVRRYLKTVDGFRSVDIHERPENFGLAQSIIQGVTDVIDQSGRVIVMEDDMVTAPGFLSYMNEALDRYAEEPQVWHISGWCFPIEVDVPENAYLWQCMGCWEWATWQNRWQHFSRDLDAHLAWGRPLT